MTAELALVFGKAFRQSAEYCTITPSSKRGRALRSTMARLRKVTRTDCSGAPQVFEVYLNDERVLLVVRKRSPVPLIGAPGKWRRKKRVLRVSDEIRSAVQRQGYYVRKLSDAKNISLRLSHGYRRDPTGRMD